MTKPQPSQNSIAADMRTIKRLIYLSVVIVLIAGGLMYQSNNQQLDDIVTARTESRVSACSDQRSFELAHNRLDDSVQGLVTTVFTQTAARLPEDQQAAVKAFIAMLNGPIQDAKVPIRDCSPVGIDAFYRDRPANEDLRCVSDGKGYCR